MNRINLFSLLLASTILAGCATTYEAERTNPETGTFTKLKVKSNREFQGGVKIYYNRETGTFELQAGEVTTGISPLEEAAAQLLLQMPILLSPAAIAVED